MGQSDARRGRKFIREGLKRMYVSDYWWGVHLSAIDHADKYWMKLAIDHHSARVKAETDLMELKEKFIAVSKELSKLKRDKGA